MSPFPRQKTTLRQTAPVTFWLVATSVAVSLWTWLSGVDAAAFFGEWGLVPARFVREFGAGELATILTSMFLHGGLLHIAFNAMMLYFLGRLVEPMIGSSRFAALYAVSGAFAALAQVAFDPWSSVPMVGASGAISGVFGAAMLLAPRTRVMVMTPFTLFIPIAMRLRTFALIWVALQVVGIVVDTQGAGGIAYMAHLGGFVAGLLAMTGLAALVEARRRAAREAYAGRVRHGPAPDARFRTFTVTDGYGRTFLFHEPTR